MGLGGVGGNPQVPQPVAPQPQVAPGPVQEVQAQGTKSAPAQTPQAAPPQDGATVAPRAQHETGTDFELGGVSDEQLAANPAATPAQLEKLAASNDRKIRQQVAGNPSTPPALLEKLVGDQDPEVRATAAWNYKTPAQVLTTLAGDQDASVRAAAAGNPSTPREVLAKLANDPDQNVSGTAKERQAFLQKLDDAINELKQIQDGLRKSAPLAIVKDQYQQKNIALIDQSIKDLEQLKTAGDPKELRKIANRLQNDNGHRPLERPRETKEFTSLVERIASVQQGIADTVWATLEQEQ